MKEIVPLLSGLDGDSMREWASGTSYEVGYLVEYLGIVFRCITAHTASSWSSNIPYWEVSSSYATRVSAPSNSFALLDPIYIASGVPYIAKADILSTTATHVVIIVGTHDIICVQSGRYSIGLHGLPVGTYYCMNDYSAKYTTVEPITYFTNAVFKVLNSTTVQVLAETPVAPPIALPHPGASGYRIIAEIIHNGSSSDTFLLEYDFEKNPWVMINCDAHDISGNTNIKYVSFSINNDETANKYQQTARGSGTTASATSTSTFNVFSICEVSGATSIAAKNGVGKALLYLKTTGKPRPMLFSKNASSTTAQRVEETAMAWPNTSSAVASLNFQLPLGVKALICVYAREMSL